ncbi:MAG: hypothetical protein RI886_200, partial [Pseudomonadota bacterium]
MKILLPVILLISLSAFSQDQLEGLLDNSLSSIETGAQD